MSKTHIIKRLQRMHGMTGEQLKALHEANGSLEWWANCWNCKKAVARTRDELAQSDCPHCGVNLWKRT